MHDYKTLPSGVLDRFTQRSKASSALPTEPDIALVLQHILQKANELVPSEVGAILLDDPLTKVPDRAENGLVFVAGFGPVAEKFVGASMMAGEGIAGLVYRTGRAQMVTDTALDETFAVRIQRETDYRTRTLLAAPILIGTTVCGAIELLNRKDGRPYDPHDLLVLEVFASYTALTLQNALDARHAQELARVDDLTGLYNDRYLHVRLREELARSRETGKPCALIFLDLDHFKPINDEHGHLVGSQVIREVGFLLRRMTADHNAILARYGGDEFTLVLPGRTAEQAAELGEEIRGAIAEAVFMDRSYGPDLPALHIQGQVTASLGVAVAGAGGGPDRSVSTRLIRLADEAMYVAKSRGKNRVVISDADLPHEAGVHGSGAYPQI